MWQQDILEYSKITLAIHFALCYNKITPTTEDNMFIFSAVEIELLYLGAKVDFTKLQIEKAKASKKATKELEKKLHLNMALIKQLQTRINATTN